MKRGDFVRHVRFPRTRGLVIQTFQPGSVRFVTETGSTAQVSAYDLEPCAPLKFTDAMRAFMSARARSLRADAECLTEQADWLDSVLSGADAKGSGRGR